MIIIYSQVKSTFKLISYSSEFTWRCVLRKQLEKLFAIILGCMSAAILLAEATILPSGVDLSIFSILINSVGKQEMLVQVINSDRLDSLEAQMVKAQKFV